MVITKFLRNFNSNTTFTTPSSWQKKNHFLTPSTMPWSTWNERSSSYCYYVHYAMVMSKKYEVLFHHYTHYAVIHLKKTNFNSILETISILRSLLRWSWHIYIFTIFTTPKSWIIDNDLMIFAYTFTALWLWKKRLYSCCYYGHYAMIVPKKINLHSNTTFTEHLSCCCCYVHYAMILTQNKINFYSNSIFTTQFLI